MTKKGHGLREINPLILGKHFPCPTHEETFYTTMLLADSAISARFGWFKGTKACHRLGRFEFRF